MRRPIEPPDVVGGDYRLVRQVGSGGYGGVYEALQLSNQRSCAVKVMHARLISDEVQRSRFAREASLLREITSPHCVEILETGVDQNTPWIAMELLEGDGLHTYVRARGPLSLDAMTPLLRQVCSGLSAAHSKRIIHRDLKPHNVWVVADRRGEPHIKILDFGLSKMVGGTSVSVSVAAGSPAWMSPEQADRQGRISISTDVWSLGLLAFFMLTRRSFWRTANSKKGSVRSVLMEVIQEPIPDASQRARELDPQLQFDARLDPWFARCIARRPERRFADANEALAAFEQALRQEPMSLKSGRSVHSTQETSELVVEESVTSAPATRPMATHETHPIDDEVWAHATTVPLDPVVAPTVEAFPQLVDERAATPSAAATPGASATPDPAHVEGAEALAAPRRSRRLFAFAAVLLLAGAAVILGLVRLLL